MTTVLPYPRTAPETTPAAPADTEAAAPVQEPDWLYVRDWDRLGQPVTVTHAGSGLSVTYAHPWTSLAEAHHKVATGQAAAAILAQAVDILGHRHSTDEERAAAGYAIVDLDGITAYCVCGGLLHHGVGGAWRHIYGCEDCLELPLLCPPGDRGHHKVCVQPEPAQCEHNHCRRLNTYEASRACGCDKRSCGHHPCDPVA